LATTSNGELLVWGKQADTTERKTPEKVTLMSNENVVQVSAGYNFSLALTSKGRILSEGTNNQGQLGRGYNGTIFTEITSIPTKITFISSGSHFISGELADFHLSVGDTVLPLHKCLLSSWDYSKILFHDEKHSLQMPLETFKKILLFFYSGNVSSLSFRDTIYISSWGSFYALDDTDLFHCCQSSLSSGIPDSNWMEAFVLGIEIGDHRLQKKTAARAPASSPSAETMKMLQLLCGEKQELKAKTESSSREIEELKARIKALQKGDGPTKRGREFFK
jgi:hypothetical protein